MITINELRTLINDDKIYLHHNSCERGYISVKSEPIIREYSGRFGNGYIVSFPNKDGFYSHRRKKILHSNRYYSIAYFIYG